MPVNVWTPLAPAWGGYTGLAEYLLAPDGLVRFRGVVTLTAVPVGIPIPVEARPLILPLYFDWDASPLSAYIEGDASQLIIAVSATVGQEADLSRLVWLAAAPASPAVGVGSGPPPVLMAPWLTPLRDWLRAEPTVTAIVGGRTFLGALPLGATMPALVLWRVGGGHDRQTMDSGMVQMEAWSTSGAQAEALIAAAVAALGSAPAMLQLGGGARLGGVELNALTWAPDPDSDLARYVATLDVDVLADPSIESGGPFATPSTSESGGQL